MINCSSVLAQENLKLKNLDLSNLLILVELKSWSGADELKINTVIFRTALCTCRTIHFCVLFSDLCSF